jgi:sulfur-oxidizing protein SoxY
MINIKAILQKAIIAVPFMYGICVLTPFLANAAQAVDPLGSPNWVDLKESYLGEGSVEFDSRITLLMPPEIENSHQVPLTVVIPRTLGHIREVVILAENNPIQQVLRLYLHRPVHSLSLMIRLENSTPVRAAALLADGTWLVGSKLANVLTPGGCSAPGGNAGGDGITEVGQIAFKKFENGGIYKNDRLKFRIKHPMDTGLVTNAAGESVPAYYIDRISIHDQSGLLLEFDTQAAMSADPIITIDVPELQQNIRVTASDSMGSEFVSGELPTSK